MNAAAQPMIKRPKLVWAVFLFYILSVGYSVLLFFLVFSGVISVTPEQAEYFGNLPAFDWVITILTCLLNVAGAIAIFRLRKIAFNLFVTAFVIVILQTLVHMITTNFVVALGSWGAVGTLIGYGILFAVCIYSWKLKARGVLV